MSSGGRDGKAAVVGKAARACDSCVRRRARWYCAADDAFLCQSCDTSVHSANPLARRHERVRLRAASASASASALSASPRAPAEGFATAMRETTSKRLGFAPAWSKRKARTRRPPVKSVGQLLSRPLVVVPEVGGGESSEDRKAAEDRDQEEEQLLYRVPIFDPNLGEFCSPPPVDEAAVTISGSMEDVDGAVENAKEPPVVEPPSPVQELPDSCAHYGPTDAGLREFAADMEALLGQGLDDSNDLDGSFYMEALGLVSPAGDCGRVKVEAGNVVSRNRGALVSSRPELNYAGKSAAKMLGTDFNFSSNSPTVVDGDDAGFGHKASSASNSDANANAAADAHFFQRSLDLRLNYETIIENWGSSPWTDGRRPHVPLDDLVLHGYSGMWTEGARSGAHGEPSGMPAAPPRMNGWREARVSRYREKRRTRLFAKKIRYEVRKLNAEKRPRMKGRFVKRPAVAAA